MGARVLYFVLAVSLTVCFTATISPNVRAASPLTSRTDSYIHTTATTTAEFPATATADLGECAIITAGTGDVDDDDADDCVADGLTICIPSVDPTVSLTAAPAAQQPGASPVPTALFHCNC